MAKKEVKKKEKVIVEKEKAASPIDFINWLTVDKKKWEELTAKQQKAFQPFIVSRWLGMELDFVEAINDLQPFILSMDKEYVWKIYLALLPKGKVYLKYIKTQGLVDVKDEDIEAFKKYFQVSEEECINYYQTLNKTEAGRKDIEQIKYNFIKQSKK